MQVPASDPAEAGVCAVWRCMCCSGLPLTACRRMDVVARSDLCRQTCWENHEGPLSVK